MSRVSFLPGDVVFVPYAPFTNRLNVKPRPVLIISGAPFNQSGPDVIVAPISSNIRYGDTRQVVIEDSDCNFSQTGLKRSSAIKCGAIFAYSKSQIARRLGKVDPNVIEQVRKLVIDIITKD